ncbi:MAG: hypothetical protein ACOCZU_01220 [Planctomycetota bacterium]
MNQQLAAELMGQFAERTGLTGEQPPDRYLWTDAFAVCNFLGLAETTGDDHQRKLAFQLADQVHGVLGRHRPEDERTGPISGLSEDEARNHPTAGGLRIGKKLPERAPDTPYDPRLEWDRDGQYFHYLTKWMHALEKLGQVTGEADYHRWAAELAKTAHEAFAQTRPGGQTGMVWKMSIDLSRPLVPAMGQHDPLDALVTELQIQTSDHNNVGPDLSEQIDQAAAMCSRISLATEDPLGIGGLLTDVGRVAELTADRGVDGGPLLRQLLEETRRSLSVFSATFQPDQPAQTRLAFRELGLAIGLSAVERARQFASDDATLRSAFDALQEHRPLAEAVRVFWSDRAHRTNPTWTDHEDINAVMLATSLAPEGYLGL